MAYLNLKRETKLRVKEMPLNALGESKGVTTVDATKLPEGHLSCSQCHGFKFECNNDIAAAKIVCGCLGCGAAYNFIFPLDVSLKQMGNGRFTCKKHDGRGFVVIHNTDKLCFGCESCKTQVVIDLKTRNNLVIADA
jgi:hypothetical protein